MPPWGERLDWLSAVPIPSRCPITGLLHCLTPPRDGVSLLVPFTPAPPYGAVVFELARPGCAPDAVTLSPVTADGRRLTWPGRAGGNKRTLGNGAGRILEVAAPTGAGWPDAAAAPLVVAVVEGEADALALARLRLPGVLVRAAGGTSGMIGGAALVADLPATVAVALVSDGDRWPHLLCGGAARRRPGRSVTRRH